MQIPVDTWEPGVMGSQAAREREQSPMAQASKENGKAVRWMVMELDSSRDACSKVRG